ncbi:hypothetical protein G647_03817 [Cladophialophora carrionii CBS 160.54]|uniref:Polycomb protein VEFS-Box domain-containing protein n=1 Tax=Cladophialophora carrionii CBS 160.54 TaxID=1279043 RepID=V9DDQ5_9EURO|nr:uncharacterized protein G647_03817 [Cladophialophora carrionii CBS 160.54]ETI24448.1 hypothetical protein G647_03817 [Cladophialophora carrionii CBS 160.54]
MENGVSNHPSTAQRHKLFAQNLVGHFTWTLERPKSRQHLFLQRNISRILAHHEERLRAPSSRVSRPLSAVNLHSTSGASGSSNPRGTGRDQVVNSAATDDALSSAQLVTASDQASTTGAAMTTVQQTLQSRDKKRESSIRRSTRFKEIVDRVYQQAGAELILDLSNIRKKLNFKTNSLDDGERPAKRQKRDSVRCLCHLTVWDNRDGFAAVPLTSKSSYCWVTGAENGAHGHFVDIELDKPFIVRAAEIRVPVTTKNVSALEVIDKYFLEFKIIPCKAGSRWPPMPILGKSDGDHFGHDIKQDGSEELQGAIVARYTHLPTPPDINVPLSVFFLHEGRTYRTKYGLQVISAWQKADAGRVEQESRGLNLDSFLRDQPDGIHPHGKAKNQQLEPLVAFLQEKSLPKPVPQTQPEVCYSFSGRFAQRPDVAQEFRNATVRGYQCPVCTATRCRKLEELQFHLTTMHTKYTFSVKPRIDPATNEVCQVHIKVDQPKRSTARKGADNGEMSWVAPTSAFDLRGFMSGDHSWVGGPAPIKVQPSSRPTIGYPLAEDVPDFRLSNRKKIKPIPLETRGADDGPEYMYTSVSNRPVSPDEDPRSESDDEIDNEWQIAMQMERLDLIAERGNWSPYERELAKRWDRHRMEEQLEHPAYISNSLIRFARKHRQWLRNSGGDELLPCFFDFLERLKERDVIDNNVVMDVNELIFVDDPPQPFPTTTGGTTPVATTTTTTPRHGTSMPPPATPVQQVPGQVQEHAPQTLAPKLMCPLCSKVVKFKPKRNAAVFCQDPRCATPSQRYHLECILPSTTSRKGKERAVTPISAQDEALTSMLRVWSCQACKARRKGRATSKAEGSRGGGKSMAKNPSTRYRERSGLGSAQV